MILKCRNKRCGKTFNTEGLIEATDRKGKFVLCPYCNYDSNIPIRYKLIQMKVREDIYEQIRARARQYGFTKITPFIRIAAVSFVPGNEADKKEEEGVPITPGVKEAQAEQLDQIMKDNPLYTKEAE